MKSIRNPQTKIRNPKFFFNPQFFIIPKSEIPNPKFFLNPQSEIFEPHALSPVPKFVYSFSNFLK